MDGSPAPVAAFREGKFPMPWDHAYLGMSDGTPLHKALGLDGIAIPFYMLVDANGTIVAASPALRMETLPGLVEKALK
jgi:hypothetical protein